MFWWHDKYLLIFIHFYFVTCYYFILISCVGDGLVGFMLLSSYWCGINSKITKHYMNIARMLLFTSLFIGLLMIFLKVSIFYSLPQTSLPPNIRYILAVSAIMLNNAISETEKLSILYLILIIIFIINVLLLFFECEKKCLQQHQKILWPKIQHRLWWAPPLGYAWKSFVTWNLSILACYGIINRVIIILHFY